MKLFTYMDYINGTCKPHEIDAPWEPRWTTSDAALGLVDSSMVGTPKPLSGDPDPAELLPDDMFEHELSLYRANPTAYKNSNPPALVVKLMATAEDRRQRAQTKPDWMVDSLSPKIVASLSSDDLKRFVLHRATQGMDADQQAEALERLEPKT